MQKTILFFSASFVLLVFTSTRVLSQIIEPERETLLATADSLQRMGDIREARTLYDNLLRQEPKTIRAMLDTVVARELNRIPVLIGRAKTFMTEGWWSKGLDDLQTVLMIEPNNIESHYLAGICNCELGIPFTRDTLEFRNKAKKHFEYVIHVDSLYEDVLNEYALVFLQEEYHKKAFDLGHLQVKLKPQGKKSYTGLFRLYRLYLAQESESTVREYLMSQSTEIARYHLAELSRRKDDLDNAERVFREMLKRENREIPPEPVLLSLAKVLFKKEMDAEAERYYWQAIDTANTIAELRFVYEDLKYIMTPREVELFRIVDTSVSAQKTFYRTFWGIRNPNITARVNRRIAEHYRRLAYAEENYECFMYRKLAKPMYYYSSQSQRREAKTFEIIDEPVIANYATYALNREYDDRGYVYIRYGEPDTKHRTVGFSGAAGLRGEERGFESVDLGSREAKDSQKQDDNFRYMPPNLTWLYKGSSEADKRIFEFIQVSSFYNEWRLGLPILEPEMLNDRVSLDPLYDELFRAWQAAEGSPQNGKAGGRSFRLRTATRETAKEFRGNATTVLTTERLVPEEKVQQMDLATSMTTFRGENGKTMMDIAYAVPMDYLSEKLTDSAQTINLEIALQLHSSSGELGFDKVDTSNVRLLKSSQGYLVRFYRFAVPADSYAVALQVQPLGVKLRGNWDANVGIPDYWKSGLAMSDIQFLLPSQARGTLDVEGIRVVPSPFNRLRSDQTLRTYVQIYGLATDVSERTSCKIEYEFKRIREEERGVVASVMSIFKSKKRTSYSVSFDAQAPESMITQYMPFAMEQFEPGQYTLTVRVRDKRLNKVVEKSRIIGVYEAKE